MRERQILEKARELLLRGWTQRAFARNQYGTPVPSWATDACCWCAHGAIVRAQYELFGATAKALESNTVISCMEQLDVLLNSADLSAFNDLLTTTQKDVLDLFDRAIEMTERIDSDSFRPET